jgi:hypothetical protein
MKKTHISLHREMGSDYLASVASTIILISLVAIWAGSTAGGIGTRREALLVDGTSQIATAGPNSLMSNTNMTHLSPSALHLEFRR